MLGQKDAKLWCWMRIATRRAEGKGITYRISGSDEIFDADLQNRRVLCLLLALLLPSHCEWLLEVVGDCPQ